MINDYFDLYRLTAISLFSRSSPNKSKYSCVDLNPTLLNQILNNGSDSIFMICSCVMIICSNDLKYFDKFPCSISFMFFFCHQLLFAPLLSNFCLQSAIMHYRFHQLVLRIFSWCNWCWLFHFRDSRTSFDLPFSQRWLFLLLSHINHHRLSKCMLIPCKSLKCLNCLILHSFLLT